MNKITSIILSIVTTAIVTVLVVYLTPLKHLNIVSPSMVEISPVAFNKAFNENPEKYLFVDVRSPSEYAAAHPKGSINIPIANLAEEAVRAGLPKEGKRIVLTCTDGRLAAVAYGYLQNWGYLNLMHLTGGLQQWSLDGLPVEGTNVPKVSLSLAHIMVCPGNS